MPTRARIEVRAAGDGEFDVTVASDGRETRHRVAASQAVIARLGASRPAEEVIEAAFRFLLDREPQEAILGRFELPVISRYFPDFEAMLPRYLEEAR